MNIVFLKKVGKPKRALSRLCPSHEVTFGSSLPHKSDPMVLHPFQIRVVRVQAATVSQTQLALEASPNV